MKSKMWIVLLIMGALSANATIGSSYLHDDNNGKGEKSMRFTVTAPEPVNYATRFHYNTHETRSSCTSVTVKIGEDVQSFSVNQRVSDGKGFVLGTFAMQVLRFPTRAPTDT